jgi:hypothetical protein
VHYDEREKCYIKCEFKNKSSLQYLYVIIVIVAPNNRCILKEEKENMRISVRKRDTFKCIFLISELLL